MKIWITNLTKFSWKAIYQIQSWPNLLKWPKYWDFQIFFSIWSYQSCILVQHSPDLFTPGPATAVQDIRPPSSYCWLDQGEPTEFGKRGLCCWAIHARFAKDKVINNPKNTMERGKNSRKPKKKLVESSYYPYQAICHWLASVSFSLYLWFYLSYEINNSYNLPFYCFTSCLCIFSQS